MKSLVRSMLALTVLAVTSAPPVASAQQKKATSSKAADTVPTYERVTALERENKGLRSEVTDLRLKVHDMETEGAGFDYSSAATTFLLTTGLVALSYYAADQTFGDSTRTLVPALTTMKVVGFGTLAAAGPAFLAGLGNGMDSPAVVSAGITLDVLLALAPWGVGAVTDRVARSKIGKKLTVH